MPPISLKIIGPYYNYSRFLWWQRGTYNSCIIYSKDGLSSVQIYTQA